MTKFPQAMLHIDPASKTAQFQHVISFLAAVPTSTHVYAGGPKTKPSVVLYLRLRSLWTEYIFQLQWKMPDTKIQMLSQLHTCYSPWRTLFSVAPCRAPLTSPSVWMLIGLGRSALTLGDLSQGSSYFSSLGVNALYTVTRVL